MARVMGSVMGRTAVLGAGILAKVPSFIPQAQIWYVVTASGS